MAALDSRLGGREEYTNGPVCPSNCVTNNPWLVVHLHGTLRHVKPDESGSANYPEFAVRSVNDPSGLDWA